MRIMPLTEISKHKWSTLSIEYLRISASNKEHLTVHVCRAPILDVGGSSDGVSWIQYSQSIHNWEIFCTHAIITSLLHRYVEEKTSGMYSRIWTKNKDGLLKCCAEICTLSILFSFMSSFFMYQ